MCTVFSLDLMANHDYTPKQKRLIVCSLSVAFFPKTILRQYRPDGEHLLADFLPHTSWHQLKLFSARSILSHSIAPRAAAGTSVRSWRQAIHTAPERILDASRILILACDSDIGTARTIWRERKRKANRLDKLWLRVQPPWAYRSLAQKSEAYIYCQCAEQKRFSPQAHMLELFLYRELSWPQQRQMPKLLSIHVGNNNPLPNWKSRANKLLN